MMKALAYDDVLLYPQQGIVASRSEVNIQGYLNGWKFRMPIMSAPMESVTDYRFAVAMSDNDVLGVLHRFTDLATLRGWAQSMPSMHPRAVAAGLEMLKTDIGEWADIVVLDVAHSDTGPILRAIEQFKKDNPQVFLIVGSLATYNAARRAINAGADALRVGIGAGAACTTRTVTGFGVPMVTSIQEASQVAQPHGVPVIADGGIKTTGDIVKALAVGADWVMAGRIFAGVKESPGGTHYFGQASPLSAANTGRFIEGVAGEVEPQGYLSTVLDAIEDAIRSGVSYGGGKTIEEMRQRVVIQEVSPLSVLENGTRL